MPLLEGTSGNREMRASGIVVRFTRQTVTYEPPPVMRRPDFGPGSWMIPSDVDADDPKITRFRSWIRMIPPYVDDADDPKITRLQSWLHMIHVRRYSRLHHRVKKWMTWAGPGHDPSLHLNCTFQALQSLSTIHLL